jgi:hypothetical protein
MLRRLARVPPHLLRRVDVVHRADHLAVQPLHVIRLAEPVGDDLPVRLHRHGHDDLAAEVVEPEPREVVGNGFEVLGQRHRVGIGVHEHDRAEGVDRRREQRVVVVAEGTEALARRHLAQPAVEPPAPAVVAAAQLLEPVPGAGADEVAAVAAHVLVRAQRAVEVAHDEHRQVADAVLEVVAGIGDMVDGARDLPHAGPHALELERGELGREIARLRDARRLGGRAPGGGRGDRGPDGCVLAAGLADRLEHDQ